MALETFHHDVSALQSFHHRSTIEYTFPSLEKYRSRRVCSLKYLSNIANIGPLSTVPDSNGFLLPQGFTSRGLAKTGEQVLPSSSYVWHDLPDGGATFETANGGWIYVSNSEVDHNGGGVGIGNAINGGFNIYGIGGYSRLVGGAADTPFTAERGSASQFIGGLGLGYTF